MVSSAEPKAAARGVIFDFFGTLTDGRYELERAALYQQLALELAVPQHGFLQAMRESFDARATGFFGTPRETLLGICSMLGASPGAEALDKALMLRISIERRMATPRPESVLVLRSLRRRGVPVGMISDCGAETTAVWPDHPCADLIIAPVFSCVVGRRKPDPNLYRLAASRLGLEPDACLYVGDGGSRELSGARNVGMRAVKLSAPGENWKEELRFDAEDRWDGATITNLVEILPLLEQSLNVSRSISAASCRPIPARRGGQRH
jgi:putative hydrolase of the HAD superfamily